MSETLKSIYTDIASGIVSYSLAQGSMLAHDIPWASTHYIAVDADGAPCILLRSFENEVKISAPLKLRGISIRYNVPCNLLLSDGSRISELLTAITCVTSNGLERELFLDSCDTLIRVLGSRPSINDIKLAAEHLANIFQKLSSPPRQTVTGLIGELLIIDISPEPLFSINIWRQHKEDRYDFSTKELFLEVKSSKARDRRHYLTYEQCHPPKSTAGLLASIVIESVGGGQSVSELIHSIENKIIESNDAVYRLHEIVAETLGDALASAMGERFNRKLAEQSISIYDLNTIPAIRGKIPSGISKIRFLSDLNIVNPIELEEVIREYPDVNKILKA